MKVCKLVVGDRIKVTAKLADPCPPTIGEEGLVTLVSTFEDSYQVFVEWDSGRSLMLVPEDMPFVEVIPAVEGQVIVTPACIYCHEVSVLEVTDEEFQARNEGAHVQDAFPTRDANFRELIITGTHAECWDLMMPED